MNDSELLKLFRIAIRAEGHDKSVLGAANRICGRSRTQDLAVIELLDTEGKRIYPHSDEGCFLYDVFYRLKYSKYLKADEKIALRNRLVRRYPDYPTMFGATKSAEGVAVLANYKKRRW
ncbi:MAG: hypothetical protein AAB388_03745 [Patescibacteria group bacterium]